MQQTADVENQMMIYVHALGKIYFVVCFFEVFFRL